MNAHPPVLVPPIKLKSSHGLTAGCPSLMRSSFTIAIKALRIRSVESPRTPPPSGSCTVSERLAYAGIPLVPIASDRRHRPVRSRGLSPVCIACISAIQCLKMSTATNKTRVNGDFNRNDNGLADYQVQRVEIAQPRLSATRLNSRRLFYLH